MNAWCWKIPVVLKILKVKKYNIFLSYMYVGMLIKEYQNKEVSVYY